MLKQASKHTWGSEEASTQTPMDELQVATKHKAKYEDIKKGTKNEERREKAKYENTR